MTSTKAKRLWPTWQDTVLLLNTDHLGEGALEAS